MANLKKVKEDDVLECFLYPKCCFMTNPDEVTEDILFEEIAKLNEVLAEFTKDYIWHRDSLIFRPRTKQSLLFENSFEGTSDENETMPHIHMSLRFDEDIGDEWFIVFLICHLTKLFDGLIARLVDSDGEFLLIEAADVLPFWADPETCQNRVFIFNGAIHIVQDKQKKFVDALKGVCERPHFYKMSDKVQAALHKRIDNYPQETEKRKHKARAYLSEKAASILQQESGLIAPAIRIICNSDALERKVCRAMKYFPPEQRTMVNVKMTKCLYAMATHCRYTGDPRTGWNLPPINSPKYKAHLLGIKIACGLEMLVARAHEERRKREKATSATNEEHTKLHERTWHTFLNRLEANGYFRNLLEGSQEREKLLIIAKDYFMQHANLPSTFGSRDRSEAERIFVAWENVQTNDVEVQAQDEATLSPANSDSWLNIDPAQLEMMLGQHYGTQSGKGAGQQPMSLRDKVHIFLNQKSDIEGVQFFGERSSESESKPDVEDNGRIDFDPDMFDNALRDILDLVVPGADDEFEVSSEGSLGGDDEDRGGEMDKYMRLMDSQLQLEMVKDDDNRCVKSESTDTIESNLLESLEQEAGGSGPAGNIIGGPVRKLMHLQLQSPTTVPPDLQS